MKLPESWNAERAALDYVRWLPRFLRGLLRIRREAGEGFSFVLVPLGLTLLTLNHSAARSSSDRQLFHVTGGALARANTKAMPRAPASSTNGPAAVLQVSAATPRPAERSEPRSILPSMRLTAP